MQLKIFWEMAKDLDSVAFNWTNLEASQAAHTLAKWGLRNRWQGFVIESSLPDQFVIVIRTDALRCILYFFLIKLAC